MNTQAQNRGIRLTIVAVLVFMLVIVGGFLYRIGQPRLMTDGELQANGLFLMKPPRDMGAEMAGCGSWTTGRP